MESLPSSEGKIPYSVQYKKTELKQKNAKGTRNCHVGSTNMTVAKESKKKRYNNQKDSKKKKKKKEKEGNQERRTSGQRITRSF